ncbi:MAG TPA: SpoIID/LytB domain-containing protein [Firmicutes bacterium]|nr:SpoIID/LytB domain-containing protein [Bacillota bacterium]
MNHRLKRNRFYYIAFGIGVVVISYTLIFGVGGCPGPERRMAEKAIPRFDKEPIISVYMHDTGQRVQMPLETYIEGVVAGEMRPGWPVNAYAAQAIIARTFTMEFLSRGGTRRLHGTDISTKPEEAQAYNASAVTPDIKKAVAMTRGEVLSYRGRYIRGWFNALCAGETSLAKDGLAYKGPEPPYTARVSCPCPRYTPPEEFYWKASFSADEVRAALAKVGLNIGDIRDVRIIRRSPDDRVTLFRISHSGGSTDIAGNDLRVALGSERMRSTILSSMTFRDGVLSMEGKGFGHGVGMCQWGAYAFAKQGKSPEEIVTHYFRGVKVVKLWD